MFSPEFKITNRGLTGVISVEVANKLVAYSQLQGDWETRLKQESSARSVYAQLRYLEIPISFDDVAKIVKDEPGRDDNPVEVALRCGVVAKEKEVQMVLNILNCQRFIDQMAHLSGKYYEKLSWDDLIKINKIITERVIPAGDVGRLRDGEAGEFESIESPTALEIPYQLEDVFGWLKDASKNEIHPVNKAGVLFYELVRICPFPEFNMISVLNFTKLQLLIEGFTLRKMWSVEEDLLRNKEGLMNALLAVERNGGEMTLWIDYFVKSVAESAEKVRSRVMSLVGEVPIFKSEQGRVISLSERQIAIMEEMTVSSEMTIKEIRAVLPMVSDDTILRDLKDLIEKKLLRKKGKTKGAVYILGKVRSFK